MRLRRNEMPRVSMPQQIPVEHTGGKTGHHITETSVYQLFFLLEVREIPHEESPENREGSTEGCTHLNS